MSRLQILRQRAARGQCGTLRDKGKWFAATGRGQGYCSEGMSRREAIQLAARLALPRKPAILTVTTYADRSDNGEPTSITRHRIES